MSPSSIVITGASSGLGKALALNYAAPGKTLFLSGRDEQRLKSVARIAHECGAIVHIAVVDVCDRQATAAWLAECDAIRPVDLIIANAGVSGGTGGGGIHGETPEQAERIFSTNVDGVLHTILPLLPAMTARKRGQIAIMSSLASLRGLPSAPAYSASKAAVRAYGEALRGYLAKTGVQVNVICPGYIRTPMTDVNEFPMPFLMSPEKAAAHIVLGLTRNKARIAFPLTLYLPFYLIACLPVWLTDPLFSRLPGKPANK